MTVKFVHCTQEKSIYIAGTSLITLSIENTMTMHRHQKCTKFTIKKPIFHLKINKTRYVSVNCSEFLLKCNTF